MRQTFFAVVVAAEAADAPGRGSRFAAVVVAAIFSDAVRHIDFAAEDATACRVCGTAGQEQKRECG